MSEQLSRPAERGQAFELPKPAPSNYQADYTLAEQLQYDTRCRSRANIRSARGRKRQRSGR
jgi:hypothetical protein